MTNQPRDFDVRTARTSELLIMLDPENLIACLFGADGEGMPDDRAAAKVEMQRVQRLVIDEIDRRCPIPGATAPGSLTTTEATRPRRMVQVVAEGQEIDAAAKAAECPPRPSGPGTDTTLFTALGDLRSILGMVLADGYVVHTADQQRLAEIDKMVDDKATT